MTSDNPKCETCRWFAPVGEIRGNCMRYPPQFSGAWQDQAEWASPIVSADYWCGEHQPIPAAPLHIAE